MKFNNIEKNIPVPDDYCTKYPFEKLSPGQSILIEPESDEESLLIYNRIKSAANIYGKRHNQTLKTRSYKTGIRVWRVK